MKLIFLCALATAAANLQRQPAGRAALARRTQALAPLGPARAAETTTTLLLPDAGDAVAVRGGEMSSATRGAISIAGGMLCHLALGTLYCWGNFLTYAPRSLLFFDGAPAAGRTPDALYVLPAAIIFQTLGLNVGARLNQRLGCANTALLGGLLFALAVFLASFQTRLGAFMLCYSVLFGAGIGLAYSAPMVAGWSWFPKRKGFVNGCVLAAFGSGGFFGNKIGSAMVNPRKLQAVGGALPAEVYAGFAPMLRKLAGGYALLTLAGASLIRRKPAPAGAAGKRAAATPGLTCGQAVRTKEFWLLFGMFALSASAGLNTASVYKSFGVTVPALNDDGFQSLMGGLGALFNGLGRLFWASMVGVAAPREETLEGRPRLRHSPPAPLFRALRSTRTASPSRTPRWSASRPSSWRASRGSRARSSRSRSRCRPSSSRSAATLRWRRPSRRASSASRRPRRSTRRSSSRSRSRP